MSKKAEKFLADYTEDSYRKDNYTSLDFIKAMEVYSDYKIEEFKKELIKKIEYITPVMRCIGCKCEPHYTCENAPIDPENVIEVIKTTKPCQD